MALPTFYRVGYQWYRSDVDPINDVYIYSGSCRSIGDTEDIVLNGAPFVKRLDATWASGSGNGGLDAGTRQANTWYYIWAIKNSTTGAVDVLLSLLADFPHLPTGFNHKRLVGAIRTGASNLQLVDTRFMSGSIYVRYANPGENGLDVSTATLGTTRVQLTLNNVPPFNSNNDASVMFDANITLGHASLSASLYISNPDMIDSAPSLTASPLSVLSVVAGETKSHAPLLYANDSGKIAARSTQTNTNFKLQVLGYYWPDRERM